MDAIAAGFDRAAGEARPPSADPIVLAAAATGIVPFIEHAGGDVDGIFGSAGIAPDMAGQPTLQVRLSAYCRLFEESARRTANDNFGLWFGNQFQPRDLGMWGYAAISAPTVGSALETLVNLFPYHQESSTMRLARGEDGMMRLEYGITAPDIVQRRQDAELSLGMFLNVIREGCGPTWAPEEVHFEHPRPLEWHAHEAAFLAPAFFGQPTNAIVFRPETLSRPMPGRDLRLLAVMQTCLESIGSHRPAGMTLFDRIRATIRVGLASGRPELAQVAAELRLAPGVIQRELADHGLTYRAAVEDMRRTLAAMYLESRELPLTEIAFLLGYSELSAFTRAFTRWTGTCPRTFRKARVRH